MLAILNYTQAIKCKPMDADTYFRRGEMCETANRVLAIDDFSKVSCFTILPFIYFRSLYSHPNNIGNSWNSFVHVVWPNLIYFRLGPRTFIIGIDITTVTNAFFFFFYYLWEWVTWELGVEHWELGVEVWGGGLPFPVLSPWTMKQWLNKPLKVASFPQTKENHFPLLNPWDKADFLLQQTCLLQRKLCSLAHSFIYSQMFIG